MIAKAAKIGDHNRIGLFDTATRKTFKNRQAVLMEIPAVADSSEVLVKDLGQFSTMTFHKRYTQG